MNWSSLLPSTSPVTAFKLLTSADLGVEGLRDGQPFSAHIYEFNKHLSTIASQALRDSVIYLALGIAVGFALIVLRQTFRCWMETSLYLAATEGGDEARKKVQSSDLSLFRELQHHLIEFHLRDGTGGTLKRRTVDAEEVFRDATLAPPFLSSRLILAIPSILTGLGVLGTFIGLQLGIGSLDLKNPGNLDKTIIPLIEGCAVAFSSSVWGVGASLLFSGWEKFCENIALGRVRKIQIRINSLFPRYVPEEAMSELERSSRGTEELLKGLAVAIGAEMQQAIGRLGSEIKDAVSSAASEGQGPLMEKSAELLSNALTAELVKLKEQIGIMSDQFSDRFNGTSDGLLKSVQGFQPTVEALSGAVGDAQRTVTSAVAKLNAHEGLMQEMAVAALNIRQAAEAFGGMNQTLTLSSSRNEEASKAQLAAAQSNERAADQFGLIGERLPEIRQTLEDAARVIGSLGSPIADLQVLLAGQPELQRQLDSSRASSEAERSQLLLSMSGDLAEKVGHAAQQFAQVGSLADKLTVSAASLEEASSLLSSFGAQLSQSSNAQRDASEASRAAAASGERTAKAFEPLPGAVSALLGGLTAAGASVRSGAEAAGDSYRELITLQKQWFSGAELGLNGMKDRLQSLLKAYGEQVEGQTRDLMKQWTEEVAECLQSYETQVSELQGGLDELQSAISKLSK
ncbi:MAG: anti-phage ZorAB system protein ZorA [Chthoniobacteraceae bacterium]|nr:anti-phage ZorAB system protein ZorA [Chthoniobacteraceae bacterium]